MTIVPSGSTCMVSSSPSITHNLPIKLSSPSIYVAWKTQFYPLLNYHKLVALLMASLLLQPVKFPLPYKHGFSVINFSSPGYYPPLLKMPSPRLSEKKPHMLLGRPLLLLLDTSPLLDNFSCTFNSSRLNVMIALLQSIFKNLKGLLMNLGLQVD